MFRFVFIGKNLKEKQDENEKRSNMALAKFSTFWPINWKRKKIIKIPASLFLDIDVRNISAKLQIVTFSSFWCMRRFVNCSAERKEDFGTLLKYTINSEIGNFQIAISRARSDIFGRTKKRLVPYILDFHISTSHFLTCRPPPLLP